MEKKLIIDRLLSRGDNLSVEAAKKLQQSISVDSEVSPENVVKKICEIGRIEDLSRKTPEATEARRVAVFVLVEFHRLPMKSVAPLVGVHSSNVSRLHMGFKNNPHRFEILKKFNF